MGNIIKNASISIVRTTKLPHERMVTFVDFFRLSKKPLIALIIFNTLQKNAYTDIFCLYYFILYAV